MKLKASKRIARWLSRIWSRILLAFIACMVPLICIQLYIQRWSSQAVRERVYSSAYADIAYLRDHFAENTALIQTNMQYVLDADDVRSFFVYYGQYTPAQLYESAQNVLLLLKNMRNANTLVRQLMLYFPRQGIMFQSSTMRTGLFPLEEAEFNARYDAWKAQENALTELDGQYMLLAARGEGGYGAVSPLPALCLAADLDQGEILRLLSSYNSNTNSGTLQYNHATGTLLWGGRTSLSGDTRARLSGILEGREDATPYSIPLKLDGRSYVLLAGYASSIHSTFGRLIPEDELNAIPNRLRNWMVAFSLTAALMLVILSLYAYRQVARPTAALLRAFDQTSSGQFDTRVQARERPFPYEYEQLREHFNDMNLHIEELIAENYEYTIDLKEAQFKQLQAQINPHFLYNSFFLLRNIVSAGETEQCERFLACLGSYFRYISQNENDTAALSEEYEHAVSYLTIQAMRFENGLQLDMPPLPEDWKDLVVPRLILQPLLENVMVHGVWTDGAIRRILLSFREEETNRALVVEDNGQGVTEDTIRALNDSFENPGAPEHMSGLMNINRRVRLYYGGGGLSASRSDLGGLAICLRIPRQGGKRHA